MYIYMQFTRPLQSRDIFIFSVLTNMLFFFPNQVYFDWISHVYSRSIFTETIKLGYRDWSLKITPSSTQCRAKHVPFEGKIHHCHLS